MAGGSLSPTVRAQADSVIAAPLSSAFVPSFERQETFWWNSIRSGLPVVVTSACTWTSRGCRWG